MKLFTLIFCLNLCHCFLAPRLQVRQALAVKNCSKLSRHFIYDLSVKEINKSIFLCLEKKEYHLALVLLNYLEKKTASLEEKINIWRQKTDIYQNHLFLYSSAILELEKILKHKPKDYTSLYSLLKTQIKEELFDSALKTVSLLLNIPKLEDQKKIEIQFMKARLFVLNKNRKQALDLFTKIKDTNPPFFDKMQGAFYTALLLEEEERFDSALEELKSLRWPFSDVKSRHWIYRKKNSVNSR